jgi:hypothetical protein
MEAGSGCDCARAADEIERLREIKASREDVLGEKIGEIVKLRGLLDKAVRSLCLDDYTEQQAVASEIAAIHQQQGNSK